MSTSRAIIIACALLLAGAILRVAPYVDRFESRPERIADSETSVQQTPSICRPEDVPSRLSRRPLRLVVAGLAVELALYGAAFTALLRSHHLVAMLAAVPPMQLAMRLVLFTGLIAGFLAGSPHTFPFVAWRMYSGIAERPPSAYVAEAVTRSHASVRLDLGQALPTLGRHRAYAFVAERADRGDAAGLKAALRTVGRLYDRQHPDDPIESLTLRSVTIPLDNHRPPWLRDGGVVAVVEMP